MAAVDERATDKNFKRGFGAMVREVIFCTGARVGDGRGHSSPDCRLSVRALLALDGVSQTLSSDSLLEIAKSDPVGAVSKDRFQPLKKESLVGHDAAPLRTGRAR